MNLSQLKQRLPLDRNTLVIIAILFVPNLIMWIAFYPGFLQPDHQAAIARLVLGDPTQWHSALWQYLAVPFLYFSPSWGIYGLVQIICFILCGSYAVVTLRKTKLIKQRGAVILACVLAFSPMFLAYNLLYASDIIFAYLLMPITAKMVQISRRENVARKDLIALFVLLLVVSLLRKNALLLLVCGTLLLLIRFKQQRPLVAGCFAGTVVVFAAFNLLFTSALQMESSPSQEMLSVPANQIARAYYDGGDIPEDAAAYLESIRTPEEWKQNYMPTIADFEKQGLSATPELLSSWLQVVKENPRLSLRAYVDMMSPFWELTISKQSPQQTRNHIIDFYNYDVFTLTQEDPDELDDRELADSYLAQFVPAERGTYFPDRRGTLARGIEWLLNSDLPIISDAARLLWFNRGLPFAILLAGLLCALYKRRVSDFFLVSFPVACVLLSFLVFAPEANMRYAMEMYYALPILLAWIIMVPSKRKAAKKRHTAKPAHST